MDAAAVTPPKPAASELLLEHCHALDMDDAQSSDGGGPAGGAGGQGTAGRLVRALSGSHWFRCGRNRIGIRGRGSRSAPRPLKGRFAPPQWVEAVVTVSPGG